MSLPKRWREASFRGVPFKVRSLKLGTGQRAQQHQFVDRNKPFAETLGRKARSYPIEAFVIGDDYDSQKDSLIAACEDSGPGELVHPTYGTLKVVCDDCQVTESIEDGQGIATFSLSFLEAGEAAQPSTEEDAISGVLSAASALITAASNDFASVFSVLGYASFVLDEAESVLSSATDFVDTATKAFRARAQGIADFAYRLRNLKAGIKDLVQTPSKLAQQMSDSIALLTGLLPDDKAETAKAYLKVVGFGTTLSPVTQSTPNRAQQSKNQDATAGLVRQVALANAASDASQASYASFQDALSARQELTDLIDAESDTAGDEAYLALQALRASVVRAIPAQAQDLPRLVSFTPADNWTSLSLCYSLYGTLDLESEIVARNHLMHPGIIFGGRTIQVLREG